MTTLRKQKVGKYTYWQIVESKRVNGKPKPIVLMHLGTTAALLYKLTAGGIRRKINSYSHGAVWALWKIAAGFNITTILKSVFSSQVRAGLVVGEILLLGALHRAIEPGSKRSFSDWVRKTSLPHLAKFDPRKVDSQVFWDQMDTVTDTQLEEAEMALTAMLKDKGLLTPKLLFYDTSNFFTFIATDNMKCSLPQRGKNKQKRNDLRQFGLRQIMTREFLIPIFSDVYPGNVPDSTLFVPQITQVRKKMEELHYQIDELTLVFDKGSNSQSNFAALDKQSIPYVASLTAGYHEDLINIPPWRYYECSVQEKRIRCFRTHKKIWGKDRTVVLYLSEKLRQGQIRGLNNALAKKNQHLQELKEELHASRTRRRDRQVLERIIQNIIHGERGDLLIDYEIQKRRGGRFDIEWSLDRLVYHWLTDVVFGKRILVTCRDEWPEAEIISAYRGQSNIERIFRHFKNPYHTAIRPQYHWTDQKIKVHTFICTIGLLLAQILWKQACEKGYKLSIEKILDRLTEVRQVESLILTDMKGRPWKNVQLEEMDSELQALYDNLTDEKH